MMSRDGICQSTANGVAECDEGLPEQGAYSPPIQPFPILHQILTSNLRSSRITIRFSVDLAGKMDSFSLHHPRHGVDVEVCEFSE